MSKACLAVLMLLPALRALAGSAAPLDRLESLVGNWEAKTNQGVIRVSYRTIAGGSALVQSFVTPSGRETLTVFHLDGRRLLATHYCAQGNQPRLELDAASTAERLVFTFVDATNLASRAAHLVRLELRLEGAQRYTEIETYDGAGEADVTTLDFHRVR